VSTASADLATWLTARRSDVEAGLVRFLQAAAAETPATLEEAMGYSLMAGGKRLRPVLVLASAEASAEALAIDPAGARGLALPAACAVELIHTYSLVHDDLPAMDNDTLRRGRPTSHVVFGEGMAILCGDALLTEAFALLAREPRSAPGVDAHALSARKLKAIAAIAGAAGAAGMVGGQALDLLAATPGAAPLDLEALRAMHSRKTGALITGSAVAGSVLAGAPDDCITAIRAYAEHLGLAFQIVDDILDVEGASAQLGKTAGKDAAAGKPTYPALYGLEQSRRLAAESVDRAIASLEPARIAGQLPAIARWVLSRTH
jgi:geranylgeranyl diphosphate synthase, type II